MNNPPDAVYAVVRDTDPDVLDSGELDAYLRRVAELKAWCDARQVRATRRQRQLAAQGRATDPRHSLASHGRQSSKDAHTAAERETVCTAMPGFENALVTGSVSAGHVDAVAATTRNLDDAERAEFAAVADELLVDATKQGVDTFARNCRDLARDIRNRSNTRSDLDELEQRQQSKISRWVDKTTGMHKTLIECDPLSDRQFWAAVQRARNTLKQRNQRSGGPKPSWDRLTVDALVEAVTTTGTGRSRPTLVVHTDLRTLTEGRHPDTLCETDNGVAIPVDTMRRLACEADIIPIVLNDHSVVLDEGRAKRLATFEQRIAIEAMQTTCSHPDCTVTIDDCRIHHTTPWEQGGPTNLADLAALCEPHHHLVHEGGWRLELTADRTATWTRPDGTTYWTGTINDRHRRAG